MTTPFRQKVSLILGSVLVTLLILELVLRLGGMLFLLRQERLTSAVTFKDKEFRILCLGESTTALGGENSYPFQLERILKTARPDAHFVVINRGLVSKSSSDILDIIGQDLDRYRPDLVITMVGINDRYALLVKDSLSTKVYNFLRQMRVFHLGELLREHLQHKFQRTLPSAGPVTTGEELMSGKELNLEKMGATVKGLEQAVRGLQRAVQEKPEMREQVIVQIAQLRWQEAMLLAAMGQHQRVRSRYAEAEGFLLAALQLVPNDPGFLLELGRCYKDQKDCLKAIPYFQKSIYSTKDPVLPMMELGRCYVSLGRDADAYALAQEILKQKNDYEWVYPEVGAWLLSQGHLSEAESFFLKAREINPLDAEPHYRLAEIYARQGDREKASNSRKKADEKQGTIDYYYPETVQNYQKIAEQIRSRGIRFIAMQYPLRKIEPLKDIFKEAKDVIYVENKENFETALKSGKYQDYFVDNFGVNFGHCTRRGNRLIAQQLSDVITREVLK